MPFCFFPLPLLRLHSGLDELGTGHGSSTLGQDIALLGVGLRLCGLAFGGLLWLPGCQVIND